MSTLDYSEFDPTGLKNQTTVLPGRAVLQITGVFEKKGYYCPYLAVNFDVMAHDIEAEVGKEYFQVCPLSGKAGQGTLKLALASGILTMQDLVDAKAAGMSINFDLEDAIGEMVAGEIVANKEKRLKVWDWYAVSDSAVADYPKVSVAAPEPENKPLTRELYDNFVSHVKSL